MQEDTLLSLLREVPLIFELATSATLRPLRATNRDLRQLVNSSRSTVGVFPTLTDAIVLAAGNWVTLVRLRFRSVADQHIQLLVAGSLPCLQHLDLSHPCCDKRKLATRAVSTTAASHLAKGKWPLLCSLNIRDRELTAAATAQLKHGKWPFLGALVLDGCLLDAEGLEHLVTADWHKLKLLSVSHCRVTPKFAAQLSSCNWPLLCSFICGHNMCPATICNFSHGQWTSILHLDLSFASFNVKAAQIFSMAQMPHLTCLELWDCNLTADSVAYMVQANWPQLRQLDLTYNEMTDEAFRHVSHGSWPELRVLILGATGIDAVGVGHLKHGNWPALELLNVTMSDPIFPNMAVAELVSASWPNLQELDISGIELDDEAAAALALGQWPILEALRMSQCNLSSAGLYKNVLGLWPTRHRVSLGGEANELAVITGARQSIIVKGIDHVEGLELSASQWPALELLVLAHGDADYDNNYHDTSPHLVQGSRVMMSYIQNMKPMSS